MQTKQIKICYIFRKKGIGYSIETLFDNIIAYLPGYFQIEKIYLKHHTGLLGRLKNLWQVRKYKHCDLYHITGDVNYISLALPKNKTIITFHDLDSLLVNSSGPKKLLLKTFWLTLPVKKSRSITVISQKTKDALLKSTKINQSKIHLIPNCIEDSWFADTLTTKNTVSSALVIGTKENKNLKNIAIALQDLNITLKIIGKLSEEQKQLLQHHGIKYENYTNLTRPQVRTLYQQSDLLLFPSLYEGFGLPVIEAQALGLPVITSNREPLISVSGKAALLVDPLSPQDIRTAIVKLQTSDHLRQKLIQQGFANAQKYRCSKIAQLYAKLYMTHYHHFPHSHHSPSL